MADWTDDQLRNMSQRDIYLHINNGDLTVNQYRRSRGWLPLPDGDRQIERYSDMARHDMSTPRFDEFDSVTDVSSPDAKKTDQEVTPDFCYGLVFGLLIAIVFWAVIALPLWLVLR